MNLKDKLWKTRKSRINASDRLKFNDLVSQMLLAYYSFFIITVTILGIKDDTSNYEILTLILSILILVVSVFIFAMNYKERSLKLQNTYIKIEKLLRKLSNEKDESKISKIETEYDEILECSENHNSCDYLQILFEVRNDKKNADVNPPFTKTSWVSFLWCKIKKIIFIFTLFMLPIITLFCMVEVV